jgi:hypothetical protein
MSDKPIQLTAIQLDDGTTIYIETKENIAVPEIEQKEETKELTRGSLGKGDKGLRDIKQSITQNFQGIENTIKAYTNYTLNAVKQVGSANIDKVTLEFGINIGGKTGIPYVTEGSANSSLKITVECSFPDESES